MEDHSTAEAPAAATNPSVVIDSDTKKELMKEYLSALSNRLLNLVFIMTFNAILGYELASGGIRDDGYGGGVRFLVVAVWICFAVICFCIVVLLAVVIGTSYLLHLLRTGRGDVVYGWSQNNKFVVEYINSGEVGAIIERIQRRRVTAPAGV